MQPKLNPIRLEMLKDISKFSRMDTQNTMNKIIDVVYMDPKLKKQIFKKWFVRKISQHIKRLTSLTYKVLPKSDKKYLKYRNFSSIFFPTMKNLFPDHIPTIRMVDLVYPETVWHSVFFQKAVTALKKTSSDITWSLKNPRLNSPGGIRTCDQSVNSRSLYRWATEE